MHTAKAMACSLALFLSALGACTPTSSRSSDSNPAASKANAPLAGPPMPVLPGLQAMAAIERLPLLYPPGTQTKQFSSHDPRGGNHDGHFLRSFTKYQRPAPSGAAATEYVFFDEYGPGCLYRQQMNIWKEGFPNGPPNWIAGNFPNAGSSRIRFYFDNETTPRIDQTFDAFFGGSDDNNRLTFKDAELPDAGAYHGPNRFAVQYSPLPFAQRLVVAVVPSQGSDWTSRHHSWHQFTGLVYPQDQLVESYTTGSSHTNDQDIVLAQWANVGNDPQAPPSPSSTNLTFSELIMLPPQVPVTIFERTGQTGAIQSIRLSFPAAQMTAQHSWNAMFGVELEARWDDPQHNLTPAIQMPVGYFFGGGLLDNPTGGFPSQPGVASASKELKTLMFGYNGPQATFYSYWPMPYWQNARITLKNTTGATLSLAYTIVVSSVTYAAGTAGHFRAKSRRDDSNSGLAYTRTFEEPGRGHVVGDMFYSANYAMDGDEFTFIDQSRTPQIHGDGTEDDHNQGWEGSALQQPLWGGLVNGFTGAYRLHLNDAYVFFDGIKVNYEYAHDLQKAPPWTTEVVTYYYKAPGGATLVQSDVLDVGDPTSEIAHVYTAFGAKRVQLRSTFSSYERDRTTNRFEDTGYEVQSNRFRMGINPSNHGVRLRKLVNKSGNGIQIATVKVDGITLQRPWAIVHSSSGNSSQGWLESDYDIPASFTSGKNSILVEIALKEATACALSEYKYTAYSFTAP
jgi:hypothetical protein